MNRVLACDRYLLDLAALSAKEAAATPELREHLRRCEGCRTLLEALELQHAELETLADPAGFEEALAGLHTRVMARITAPPRQSRPWRPVLLWAAAACLMLGSVWRIAQGRRETPVHHPEQAQLVPRVPEAIPPVPPQAPRSARPRSRPSRAAPYDPVVAARRILESAADSEPRTMLIQQSPQVVIYWVKPTSGGNS